METVQTLHEISVHSENLISFLKDKQIGEVIPYEVLSELIDMDITSPTGRGYLNTAKRRLVKDEKMVFGTVRTVGIKLLSDEEVANTTGKSYIKSVRTKGRDAYHKNTSVEYEKLSGDAKINHQCTMTILALMNHVTSKRSLRQIENKVTETQIQIDQRQVLELLKSPNS
jgi:hypothetical protein